MADPPPRAGAVRLFFTDLKYLWLEQILEVRTTWHWLLIFSLLMPLSMLFGFARIGNGLRDPSSLLHIIAGSAIFAAANDGLAMMALRLGRMQHDGSLLYYASLPINKSAFVLALLLARLVLTLPGMLVPMLLAPLMYDIQLTFSLWIIPLLLLTALTLASVGLMLGAAISNLELLQAVCNILLFVLLMAAPLFIPLAALPAPLRALSYILPPSYAADALRRALDGSFGPRFYQDLLVLGGMALASLLLLPRWLRWQLS